MGKPVFAAASITGYAIFLSSFLCIVEINGRKFNDNSEGDGIEFHWRVEEWKTCIKVDSCLVPGLKRRSLSCLNSKMEKVASRNCDRRLRPKRKMMCVAEDCVKQTKYQLKFESWTECKAEGLLAFDIPNIIDKNTTIGRNKADLAIENNLKWHQNIYSNWKKIILTSCGSFENSQVYVKRRNATCLAQWPDKHLHVETALEYCISQTDVSPIFIQLCSFGCKQRCAVGMWNAWGNSPFLPKDFQFRTRQIMYFPYPRNNTNICPSLVDFHVLKEHPSGSKFIMQYDVSSWGPCLRLSGLPAERTLLEDLPAVIGIRHRVLRCIQRKGARTKCTDIDSRKIATSQLCILSRDCHVTEWSNWSECNVLFSNEKSRSQFRKKNSKTKHEQQRTRVVTLISIAWGKSCPPLVERRACEPSAPPVYEQGNVTAFNTSYMWFTGDYGPCKPDAKDCRSGIKIRSVFCVRQSDVERKPVGTQFCAHLNKPTESSYCRNQCKEVCVLGEWGSWSGCTADCSPKRVGIVRGTHYRMRRVIQYSGDPNACPDFAESRPCILQNCVSWVTGTQTICLMDNIHRACGNGKTHRAVYCMSARGKQVDESLCKDKKPPRSIPCHVPCSDDCVLGTWSTWGSCFGKCNLNGTQAASYRTRVRRILANPGWSGRPCPDQSELTEKESCLGESCGTYHWVAGTWSSCQVRRDDDPKDSVSHKCITGLVHRSVNCVNEAGTRVEEFLCNSFLKPRSSKQCRNCPEDCIVSPWSDWTTCPMECTLIKNRFHRKRLRFIMRPSTASGQPCPDELVQTKQCDSCYDFQWRSTDWSNCSVAVRGDCIGLRTRSVNCFRKRDSMVQPDGQCLVKSRKPIEYEMCVHRDCNRSCVITPWSEWSPCSKKCETGYTIRTRNILGNRAQCGTEVKLREEKNCNTHRCGKYSLHIGKWSRCYAVDVENNCGAGRQWRNVTCFKTSGTETALQYCIEELYGGKVMIDFERSCTVRCPLDCKLSSWTKFTPCSRKCGAGVKTRFRSIVQKATNGGRVCATDDGGRHITETIPCIERECYNFKWRTDAWNVCKVTNQTKGRITKCGTGIQTRKVYCTDSRLSGQYNIINDSYCDAKERPTTTDSCTLYCPGDCVVGEWTSWSRCSAACPKPGHRRRERTVLRYPAHDGRSCAYLEEYQTCNMKECFTHYWRPTKWSSCLFYQDDTSCGIGRQKRMADCVRSDGKIVHPFYCRVEGRRVPTLLRVCTVLCPRNCEISEWGAWSSCQNQCNTISVRRRSRFILAPAKNGGQSCLESDPLQEFRTCPMNPCYDVRVGQWDTCRPVSDKACGHGIRRRSVECVRDDGKIVDQFYCPRIAEGKYPEEIGCEIPCTGDCIMTEWSLWTSCFASCTIKNQSLFDDGTRMRVRHILKEAEKFGKKCLSNLIENESCSSPKCFTFSWKTGPYFENKREVWCERSDGVQVMNGCDTGYKPSRTQSCQPKCKVTNSFCNSKTVCACKEDFIPIFSSHGYLMHCLSDSNPYKNGSNDVVTNNSRKGKDASWFGDLPIIIWVVIGVCFVYLLLFLAIVIVYTRRRRSAARERRAETVDVGTLTNPERIPLTERAKGHERSESKASFATSSGRGSTLSTIGDHDGGEQWPEPPDDVVSEFIRQHLKHFNKGSFCSTFSDETLNGEDRASSRIPNFDISGTL